MTGTNALSRLFTRFAVILGACLMLVGNASAQSDYEKAIKDYTKVVSTADGAKSMWTVFVDKKKNQLLAQLPPDFAKRKYFIACTVASGERYAGLQENDYYVYWKQVNERLLLIRENLEVRSTGDNESKSSVNRLFTDKLLLDLPIKAFSPKKEPLFDLDELLVKNAGIFFGSAIRGANPATMVRLQMIKKAKAFPQNVEIAVEVPVRQGQLKTLHYSLSELPQKTTYKPRKADDRVGYFTTAYNDLGKFQRGEKRTRYINRWHLEKADPKLKLSPPKQPIIFYVEHSTPIRYRRFVRQGVLYWNKAFEKVGITEAIEVRYQDATSKTHMEKDPEDVRYNFIRWLNNDISTAIGPSRVDPRTGEILDADIILTDGWIRVFENQFTRLLPEVAVQGFGPDTLTWLDSHPSWDPRYLMASPKQRKLLLRERAIREAQAMGGHPFAKAKAIDDASGGFVGQTGQMNSLCFAPLGKRFDLTLLRMMVAVDEQMEADANEDTLDGVPAKFIGPLLADLVAHEVGHTLGLRHNFKASAIYSLEEINSDKVKGKKPFTASVMDYNPINVNMKDGKVQGDFAMIDIGPYDVWAIEYGYTFDDKELPKILARCTEKELQYLTDQDTIGPDPLARRYDFTSNPIDYAKNQMKLAKYHRERLLTKYVKDGESWSRARQGYQMTMMMQIRSLSMMANWIGGATIRRDHKGDKGDRDPIVPVDAKIQRDALKWILENAMRDDSFGLNAKLLRRLRKDFLESDETFDEDDSSFPVHDRVMGVQGSVLTMIMNPTTLRRVYDNELVLEADKDALTLPELLDMVHAEVWSELKQKPKQKHTSRKPLITSLRRNLQRTYAERLVDLASVGKGTTAAIKPVSTLARLRLKQLSDEVGAFVKANLDRLDPYTLAHLEDVQERMKKALESRYVVTPNGNGASRLIIGAPATRCTNPGCPHCQQKSPIEWYVPR